MEKKKIYLSGKVSGENYEEVRQEFAAVQEMLEEVGHEVFNPLDFNEELHGGDTSLPWQEYMLPLLPHIAECDIIYLMDGWRDSYGAQIERLWAERCGLEVIYQGDKMENRDKGYEEARKSFQAAMDDFESQSASSKQLEALMGEFGRITDEMAALYQRKNMDYGNSFGRTYRELGIISAVTRMSDKMERMKRLARKPEAQQVADESLRDTIRDLACYAVMTLMEMDREQEGGIE